MCVCVCVCVNFHTNRVPDFLDDSPRSHSKTITSTCCEEGSVLPSLTCYEVIIYLALHFW